MWNILAQSILKATYNALKKIFFAISDSLFGWVSVYIVLPQLPFACAHPSLFVKDSHQYKCLIKLSKDNHVPISQHIRRRVCASIRTVGGIFFIFIEKNPFRKKGRHERKTHRKINRGKDEK